MKITRDVQNVSSDYQNAVIALGNFDGFHLGHRAIIAHAKAIAEAKNCPLALMTFEPHPRVFLGKEPAKNLRIYSLRSKLVTAQELGMDIMFLIRFNAKFADLRAKDFIREILAKNLKVRHIITGENFCFGKNRQGDNQFLASKAAELGFGYTTHPQITDLKGNAISSSVIREFLANGEVKKATQLIGKPYHIEGRIKNGERNGRKIGFPTANISLAKLFLPRFGVYAIRAQIEGQNAIYNGVANLGIKPSIGNFSPNLEVHLFDFAQDIYGKHLCVEFVDFIREEQKFASLDLLKKQIENDCVVARSSLP